MRTLSEYKSMQNRSPSLRVSHQIQIHRSSRQKSRSKFLSHLLFWRELGWIWNWRLTRRSGLLWLYLERLRMRFLRNFAKKIWHLPPPSFVERVYSTKFLTHLLFWRELRWIWIWWLTREGSDNLLSFHVSLDHSKVNVFLYGVRFDIRGMSVIRTVVQICSSAAEGERRWCDVWNHVRSIIWSIPAIWNMVATLRHSYGIITSSTLLPDAHIMERNQIALFMRVFRTVYIKELW